MNTRMVEAGSPTLTEKEGELVTYTPKAGDASTPVGIFEPGETVETQEDDGIGKPSMARFKFLLSEISDPVIDDKITLDGVDWIVTGIMSKHNGMVVVNVIAYEQVVYGNKDSYINRGELK